jgi:hypothetical protein
MVLPPSASGPKLNDCSMKALIFPAQQAPHRGAVSLEREKFSMSRIGPHTSTKKIAFGEIFDKGFFRFTIQNAKKKACQVATL